MKEQIIAAFESCKVKYNYVISDFGVLHIHSDNVLCNYAMNIENLKIDTNNFTIMFNTPKGSITVYKNIYMITSIIY